MLRRRYGLVWNDGRRWVSLLLLLFATQAQAATDAVVETRERAVAQARAGETAAALRALQGLYADTPRADVLHDLIAVAHWHGDHALAAELASRLDWETAPPFAVEAGAKALRDARRFDAAAAAFAVCVRRWPEHPVCRLNAALTRGESGDLAAAFADLRALEGRYPNLAELRAARAYLHRLNRDWAAAAADYQEAADLVPHPTEYLRLAIFSLLDLGAPQRAAALAARHPEALSESLSVRLRAELASRAVRWSTQLAAPVGQPRHARTDHALALLAENARRLPPEAAALRLRERFDRLVALRQRERYDEVLDEYAVLVREGAVLPRYALNAVGDALLGSRRPEEAVAVYLRCLEQAPDDLNVRIALVFAYVEAERFPQALALADQLVAEQPDHHGHVPNPVKASVAGLAAMVRAFGAMHPQALERLEPLVREAPLHSELRRSLATVYRWRGWPRRAEAEYRTVLTAFPDDLDARLGLAATWMAQGREAEVAAELGELSRRHPDHREVARLASDWQLNRGWHLSSEASAGRSSGGTFASEEWEWRSRLRSPLVGHHLRALLWQHSRQGEVPEGEAEYRHLGLGVGYYRPGWVLYAGLHADRNEQDRQGGLLGVERVVDDHWSWSAEFDGSSPELPLRAWRAGIDASHLRLALGYRWSEQRRLDLDLIGLDFSDGNRRRALSANLQQRLHTEPHFQLDAALGGYLSRNSLDGPVYFNPSADGSLGLRLGADWLSWRRYERSFNQRLGLEVGSYWQRGFGASPVYGVSYEHEWKWGESFRLRYGLSWSSKAYDGDRESLESVYGGMEWRF